MIDDGSTAPAQKSADQRPGMASVGRAPGVSRRWFVGSLLLLLGGLLGWLRFGRNRSDAIVAIVRRQLPFLDLDPNGVKAFAADFLKYQTVPSPAHFGIYSRVPVALHEFLPAGDDLVSFQVKVARTYLLSTDFFTGGADESATVRYVSFFDPYLRPCSNPFLTL